MGVALSVAGAAGVGWSRWRQIRGRLVDFELDAEVAEVRQRLEGVRIRAQRHDLVNAFGAVEGAALLLARETLSAADRSILDEVMGTGLSRLRSLLVAPPVEGPVALANVVTSLTTMRAPGLAEAPIVDGGVQVEIAPDLMVSGSAIEIGEAVRQLLNHAVGRAPSGPVCVRGLRNGDRVELWVDDRGPGLSIRQRRQICAHDGGRALGPDATGGLQVAIRLARGQGGEVLAEARRGGGESCGISWPAPLG